MSGILVHGLHGDSLGPQRAKRRRRNRSLSIVDARSRVSAASRSRGFSGRGDEVTELLEAQWPFS
eukprot:6113881-Pyramimonas_sp.AAC.1